MKTHKHLGVALATTLVIGMALATPPLGTAREVDVGKDASAIAELQKDLGAKTASDNMAQEGVALHSIVCSALAIQDAKNTITDHAATMMMSAATITASTTATKTDTATALADAGVKAIPVAHATQVAMISGVEQALESQKGTGGDASGAFLS